MNKRQRDRLEAFMPAVRLARERCGWAEGVAPVKRSVPGLALRAAAESTPVELLIYGRIGGSGWFDDGITAQDVAALLNEAGRGPINVRINSGGGDVFDGVAIHTLLARHPGTVTVYVDGLAASAASFIMLAATPHVPGTPIGGVRVARNAMVMIHDAMTGTYGNADTHRRSIELLDMVSENIADMYAEKAGEDVAYWRNLMTSKGEDGQWYTGQQSVDVGLADEITQMADDGEEDGIVWDRLAGWVSVLPGEVAEKVKYHEAHKPFGGADAHKQVDPLDYWRTPRAQTPEPELTESTDSVEEKTDADWGLAMAMLAAGLKE